MRTLAPLVATLLALLAAPPALAADPDYDADGVVAGDCAPLDPAIHPGAADRPDVALEDANCDGMDGTEANGIFVVPSGADGNPGTKGQPVATLTKALQLARDGGKDVYAAVGNYARADRVGAANNGIDIYGGYQFPSWSRTKATPTTINRDDRGHGDPGRGRDRAPARHAARAQLGRQRQQHLRAAGGACGRRARRLDGHRRQRVRRRRPGRGHLPSCGAVEGDQRRGGSVRGHPPGGGGNGAWFSTPKGGAGGAGTSSDGDPAFPASPYDGKAGTSGANSSTVSGTTIFGGSGGAKGLYGNNTPTNVSGHDGQPGNPGGTGTNGARGGNSTSGAGEAWVGESGATGITGRAAAPAVGAAAAPRAPDSTGARVPAAVKAAMGATRAPAGSAAARAAARSASMRARRRSSRGTRPCMPAPEAPAATGRPGSPAAPAAQVVPGTPSWTAARPSAAAAQAAPADPGATAAPAAAARAGRARRSSARAAATSHGGRAC